MIGYWWSVSCWKHSLKNVVESPLQHSQFTWWINSSWTQMTQEKLVWYLLEWKEAHWVYPVLCLDLCCIHFPFWTPASLCEMIIKFLGVAGVIMTVPVVRASGLLVHFFQDCTRETVLQNMLIFGLQGLGYASISCWCTLMLDRHFKQSGLLIGW